MLKYLILIVAVTGCCMHAHQFYPWAVIGAGPAGIVSVAQLLEHGVSEDEIVWIDPEFSSGRMGKYYCNVPSNQKAEQFVSFLDESSIFSSFNSPAVQAMRAYDQQQEFFLKLAVDVLTDITHYLCARVSWKQDTVKSLSTDQDLWKLKLNGTTIYARKVILAIGAHPKQFHYDDVQEIPLDIALDESKLQKLITPDDTVMVVGSSHSALLVVKYLHDFGVKKIINVYNKEPRFETPGGLAGITGYWTQNVLLNNPPKNVMRVLFDPQTMPKHLCSCTKIVYAFGYEPNEISVNGSTQLSYDLKTGVIQKNLYGIGIAFPQPYQTEDGIRVNLIGFNSFLYRAKTCMPLWLQEADMASEQQNSGVTLEWQRDNNADYQQHKPCPAAATLEWEGRWI